MLKINKITTVLSIINSRIAQGAGLGKHISIHAALFISVLVLQSARGGWTWPEGTAIWSQTKDLGH